MNLAKLTMGTTAAWILASAVAAAHPFHVSLGEVEWNADTQRIEVALSVPAGDLERALRLHEGRRVTLDSPHSDRPLRSYLKRAVQFRAGQQDSEPLPLIWVGKEVTAKAVWLYFEVALPADWQTIRVRNTLLFELEKDQANSLTFRVASSRRTVTCTWESPEQQLARVTSSAVRAD